MNKRPQDFEPRKTFRVVRWSFLFFFSVFRSISLRQPLSYTQIEIFSLFCDFVFPINVPPLSLLFFLFWHLMLFLFQSCSTLKFPIRYKRALRQISSERDEFITVSSLELPEKERLSMVKSLWNEGLLELE